MTRAFSLTRRAALAAGVSISFLGGGAMARQGQKKLVVMIARGGMDGLSVTPPRNDRRYQDLRGAIAIPEADILPLDSDFGLHPALPKIHAMAQLGQVRIAPAVAIPNNQRSHFEAQDILESGSPVLYGENSGWLNRAVGAMNQTGALSIGAQAPLILRGPADAASWSPGRTSRGERLPMILSDLYADDPVLSRAFALGLETESMAMNATGGMMPAARGRAAGAGQGAELGSTVASFMLEPGGPQVVALSIDGWDTHANQGASQGQLANRLTYLDALTSGLAEGLGAEWANTVCVIVTEFGRTARVNGTRGTDHGTASTAFVLGGGLRPGGIIGDWPGLAEASLHEGRDLRATLDVRAIFKGVLAEQMGLESRLLHEQVFPDSSSVTAVTSLVQELA